jgi:hypothetical protein
MMQDGVQGARGGVGICMQLEFHTTGTEEKDASQKCDNHVPKAKKKKKKE